MDTGEGRNLNNEFHKCLYIAQCNIYVFIVIVAYQEYSDSFRFEEQNYGHSRMIVPIFFSI